MFLSLRCSSVNGTNPLSPPYPVIMATFPLTVGEAIIRKALALACRKQEDSAAIEALLLNQALPDLTNAPAWTKAGGDHRGNQGKRGEEDGGQYHQP